MRGCLIVDAHAHPPTREYLEASGGAFVRSAEEHFRARVAPRSLGAMVQEYEAAGIDRALLLGWDAELGNGLPPVPNDLVIEAVREHPSFFLGAAGVDPRRSKAREELERCARAGLRGAKLHPSAQGLRPDDPACGPFWRACADLGLVVVVHTGTTGWGAGPPGGLGVRLEPSRPLWLDEVAARHPGVRLVAAHAGWPWHEEALAVAMHKGNVFLDVSGWLPRYLPKPVWDYANGPLRRKVLFGSDYPFLDPGRVLAGLREVLKPEALPAVLGGNAAALFRA